MGIKSLKELLGSLEKTIAKDGGKIFIILISALLLILLLNSFFTINSVNTLNKKITEIEKFNTPTNISLSIITCNGCSNVSSVIDNIKNKNVKILKENSFDFNSNNAKSLIKEYNIKKLPSIIITGQINNSKIKFDNFKLQKSALIFDNVKAPYFDIASEQLKGQVKIIEIVDSSCKDCISLSSIPLGLGKSGVFISNWKKIEYNSTEGKKLINEFGIKEVPTLLISNEIDYYGEVKSSLTKLGLNKKQGYYMLHAIQPPYRDLSENKIVGLVDLITLSDKSCASCYNVSVNKQILGKLGVTIKNENDYDVSSPEGKALILKYDIQEVPMIILSPEAKKYPSFVNAWKPVGIVEKDGWFVMQKPQALGVVKNIINGTIIGKRR